MFIWEKEIPQYLTKKGIIVRTTIFTGLFALAFINIYSPFNVERWVNQDDIQLNEIQLFLYSSLVILIGMAFIVISRIILFQLARRKKNINYGLYSFIIFMEIFSMAAVYALYVKYVFADHRSFYDVAVASLKNTALILLIPYTVLWLYFAYREKTKQLEELSSTPGAKVPADKMIPFYDENGKLKFSVLLDDLLYLEASDNYVSIHYISGNKIAKYMVRNTLKTLEKKLGSYDIVRCHRSFLVNFNKVRILKREKEGLFLELNAPDSFTLPVSKTYVSSIVESFSEFSS